MAHKKRLLDHIFVNGAVLQRDVPLKVWGWTEPDQEVIVRFTDGVRMDERHAQADENGRWETTFSKWPAGVAYQLAVFSGKHHQIVNDILMGDVWICAGQSNMELPMSRVNRLFADEIKNSHHLSIRQYQLPLTYDFHEGQTAVPASEWLRATPGQTEKFSATGFFFAKKLNQEQGVPIGLIMTAVGGTPIEAWMSKEALADDQVALAQADECKQAGFMDRVITAEQKAHDEWYQNLNEFDRGIHEKWYQADFADDDWKAIDLNVPWDEVVNLKASGSIWLRKEIEVSPSLAHQPADLILGCIVDADEVYVNGKQVGKTDYRYPPRDYLISNLKEGKNTLAIRVIAAHGMGEFVFDKAHQLRFADETQMPLTTGWKYKRALSCPPLANMTSFQYKPTGTYNGMIHPLHPYQIKGVIWYQGESNASHPEGYSQKFSTMITDWRQKWQQGDFPFIFAQLSNWSPKGQLMHWELLRDEQTKTLATPHTRMVVTNDIGEHNDLHPLNKKTVGERLAGEALSLAYGMDLVSTGPTLTAVEKSHHQLILHFETGKSTLTLKQGSIVYGLSAWMNEIEIAVEGAINGQTVVIETPYASQVTAVSYAWTDHPIDANLYNTVGLPTVPFKKEI